MFTVIIMAANFLRGILDVMFLLAHLKLSVILLY